MVFDPDSKPPTDGYVDDDLADSKGDTEDEYCRAPDNMASMASLSCVAGHD